MVIFFIDVVYFIFIDVSVIYYALAIEFCLFKIGLTLDVQIDQNVSNGKQVT